jgi:hypothetical protein
MFDYCPEAVDFLSDCVANRKELKLMGYQPNFFIPCELGGFGINPKHARGRLRASPWQRKVATACAEGILDSFLLMRNLPQTSLVRDFMKRIPKSRVSMSVDHQWWMDSTRFDEQKWSGDLDRSYSDLIGLLSRLTERSDQNSRRVSMKKLSGVRGMRSDKCFSSSPFLLVPNLGISEKGRFRGTYDQWAVRKWKKVKVEG